MLIMGTKEKSKANESTKLDSESKYALVLHNDDHNSFDFVIECLIDVCGHELTQAEQCALITHFKGKCDVKSGTFNSLKPLKDDLINKGLGVTIES